MIRWKYVIPRLSLLTLIAAGLWLGTDRLIHWVIVQTGQATFGARVTVGEVDTQLTRGQLRIRELVVADPNSPRKNLVEAGRIELDLEIGAALRRKMIVSDGRIDGLRFHTDRETDGTLAKDEDEPKESAVSSWFDQAGERGEAWLDESLDKLELEVEDELQTVQLSREFKERWPAEYQRLEQRGRDLEPKARRLRDQIRQIADDPLQHLSEVQPALAAVEALRQETLTLRSEMQRLQRQIQQDRAAVKAAKDHDVEYVRARLHLDQLDGNSLTEYLLGPVWSDRIQLAVDWIQRSRAAIPAAEATPPARDPTIGTSVVFPGFPSLPDVLFRRLQLSGGGTVNGQEFVFTGTLRDLTHQPRRHREPARLDVTSEGSIQLTAQAILDRRGTQALDEFTIDLPAVKQHGQRLGDPRKLAIEIGPGVARIQAHLFVRDEQLEGTIDLRQDGLELHPTLAAKYAKYVSPENLQAAVSGVDRLQAQVVLNGTLKRPRYRLESNLGPQLSQGINQALQQELAARQQQLLARANREIEQELNQLQQELVSKNGDLLKQLEIGDEQLNQFKRSLLSDAASPQDLISRGRKLLFK